MWEEGKGDPEEEEKEEEKRRRRSGISKANS